MLAWDGAVPAFVDELLRQGKLPNLAKLIEGGAFTDDVRAGFPAKTASGFASLITGAPPRITGISGNQVPRAPREQFTILESLAGFSAAPLRAETIWSAAARAGKKVIISHIPTFAGELAEKSVRFSGYELIAGRDGIVTNRNFQPNAQTWTDAPLSNAAPLEASFTVGESKFFALLIDDPADEQAGYDTLVIAAARDGNQTVTRLKPSPAGIGGELFWSDPVAVKTAGGRDGRVYFRLFDLKSDGSDFFLYYTRPARALPITVEAEASPSPTVRAFVGNGASILYQQGAFGRTLPNGGSGIAEERYLETVNFAQHQLMETNRWALEHLPWDLYFAYTPFPDEAEHVWRGYLDSGLPTYRPEIAERLKPFLERVYRSADEHLGLLLEKRPPDTLLALISDHGLQGIHKRVALNPILSKAGLLVLDSQGRVDLTRTRVVYPAVNNGYLLINSEDRKHGIVKKEERAAIAAQVRELLLSIRDGERQVVKSVTDAEADGEALGTGGETGGDLYVQLAAGYDFDPRLSAGALISEVPPYGSHGGNGDEAAMRTIMVWNGPGIRAGQKFKAARLIDFAPTLAWLMNLPQPRDATGRVLFEIFADPR